MLAIFLQIVDTPEEQTKFEKLYHRYKNLLFYVAYNALEDYEDAEDAVNETFFRVAKNFSKSVRLNVTKLEIFSLLLLRTFQLICFVKERLLQVS